jgi:4-hydroxy-tetrahydrodipicolinate synthase
MRDDGRIDHHLLERQADYLVTAGVDGLFVCGGTGEGAYLTTDEKRSVFVTVAQVAAGRVALCLAAIKSNTPAAIREIESLASLEPDFIVSTTPFYHGADQSVIMSHFREVARAAPAPVIVYNIPSATHNPIRIETLRELMSLDNIAGLKDSSGDFCQFSRLLFACDRDGFACIQGEDYLCGPTLLCGGDGMVTGLGNARIEPYVQMFSAYKAADYQRVKWCQSRINNLYRIVSGAGYGNGNAAIKAVTELSGRGSRWMRQAALTLPDEKISQIVKVMAEYDATAGED